MTLARHGMVSLREVLEREPTWTNIAATLQAADRGRHRQRGARLLADLEQERQRAAIHIPDWMVTARWAWKRASSANPRTLASYISTAAAMAERTSSPMLEGLRHPVTKDYIKSLSTLAGPPALKRGANPASLDDVRHIVANATMTTARVVAIAWLRAARIADVLELREGALWWSGGMIAIEQPETKSLLAQGLPRIVMIRCPAWARQVLGPLVTDRPPAGPPLERPAMFTTTRARISAEVRRLLPAKGLSAHSFRKGAVGKMATEDVELEDIAALTGHRSKEGLAAYVGAVPNRTRVSMSRAGGRLAS